MADLDEKIKRLWQDVEGGRCCKQASEIMDELKTELEQAERVVEAAQAFIDTMPLRHSDIEGRAVPRGFTAESGPAARRLHDALETTKDAP